MLFPRTIADGSAFCNRDEERKRLKYNIDHEIHTLVMSPRRYGKTSVILRSLEEHKTSFAHVDWFLATKPEILVERLIDGIALLISNLIPINEKALKAIQNAFTSLDVGLGLYGASLQLKLTQKQVTPSRAAKDAIEGLEAILIKQKKKAVVFIDEVQDLLGSEMCDEMEALIRFHAQKSKVLTFIFSGSNRKLLKDMFEDSRRPMFNMCDKMLLGRISENSYSKFIQKAAKAKWKKEFSDNELDAIFSSTERHSYFINYLCSELWRSNTQPTEKVICNTWHRICLEEQPSIANDLSGLTLNQKRILQYATKNGITEPTSKATSLALQLSPRGVIQSLETLIKLDFLEYRDKTLYIINPAMKFFLV